VFLPNNDRKLLSLNLLDRCQWRNQRLGGPFFNELIDLLFFRRASLAITIIIIIIINAFHPPFH